MGNRRRAGSGLRTVTPSIGSTRRHSASAPTLPAVPPPTRARTANVVPGTGRRPRTPSPKRTLTRPPSSASTHHLGGEAVAVEQVAHDGPPLALAAQLDHRDRCAWVAGHGRGGRCLPGCGGVERGRLGDVGVHQHRPVGTVERDDRRDELRAGRTVGDGGAVVGEHHVAPGDDRRHRGPRTVVEVGRPQGERQRVVGEPAHCTDRLAGQRIDATDGIGGQPHGVAPRGIGVLGPAGARVAHLLEHEHVAGGEAEHGRRSAQRELGGPGGQAAALVAPRVHLDRVARHEQLLDGVHRLELHAVAGWRVVDRRGDRPAGGDRRHQRVTAIGRRLEHHPGPRVAPVVHRVVDQPGVAAHGDAPARRAEVGLAGDGVLVVAEVVGGVGQRLDQGDADVGGAALGPLGHRLAEPVEDQPAERGVVLGEVRQVRRRADAPGGSRPRARSRGRRRSRP